MVDQELPGLIQPSPIGSICFNFKLMCGLDHFISYGGLLRTSTKNVRAKVHTCPHVEEHATCRVPSFFSSSRNEFVLYCSRGDGVLLDHPVEVLLLLAVELDERVRRALVLQLGQVAVADLEGGAKQ